MRNTGLDVARSTAIILVLIAHSNQFFGRFYNLFTTLGVIGVEIFFALSGYLIGNIIIREIISNPSISSLKRFYIRRWLRTLPLYYLVCFILVFNQSGFDYRFILFLQNFNAKDLLPLFPVSWSLVIEEWFYLLTPILFLLVSKFSIKKQKTFFLLCASIIAVSLFSRIMLTMFFNPDWISGIRMQPFLRMDSLAMGVMFAGIKTYRLQLFKEIKKLSFPISIAGISLCTYYLYRDFTANSLNSDFFAKTFYFTFIPVTCILLVISLEDHFRQTGLFAKLIKTISVTSYCVYLIHYNIFEFFSKVKTSFPHAHIILWILALASTYTLALISYAVIESPILRYRDSITSLSPTVKKQMTMPR